MDSIWEHNLFKKRTLKWTPGAIHKTVDAVLFHFDGSIAAQCQLPTFALFSD